MQVATPAFPVIHPILAMGVSRFVCIMSFAGILRVESRCDYFPEHDHLVDVVCVFYFVLGVHVGVHFDEFFSGVRSACVF